MTPGGGDKAKEEAVERDFPLALELPIPNPISERGSVAYSIPRAMAGVPYDLWMFDVAGRRVMPVASGPAKAGRFVIPFEVAASGRRLRAGMYFLRLRIGTQVLKRRILLAW